MERLKDLLKEKEYWTTKEAGNLIETEFGIKYTIKHVTRILRKLGMKYQKPYVNDFRRPRDAEEILKKRLEEVNIDNAIIGFLDESSQNVNTNITILWSFRKLKIRRNTKKKEKINSFGFYSLNGESVYSAKESSK